MSAIAQHDWPENWPNLFNELMIGLGNGSPDLVHGTMRVLIEFCQEVTDTQIPHVTPVLLPQLLRVISSCEVSFALICRIMVVCSYIVYILGVELLQYLEHSLNLSLLCQNIHL